MSISGKSVIICGGGFGGLTAAIALYRLCHQNNIVPPTIDILESVKSPQEKEYQDYTVSIRADSGGVHVLDKIGVLHFLQKQKGQSKGLRVASHNGKSFTVLLDFLGLGGIRVSRVTLWKTLLDHLPPEIRFHWGTTAIGAEQFESAGGGKRVRVTSADGQRMEADFLIVSDGSRSNLRGVLFPEEKLRFANVTAIVGLAKVPEIPFPFKNRHGIYIGKNGTGLFAAHETETTLLWSLSYLSDTPRNDIKIRDASAETLEKIRAEAVELSRDFPPVFQNLVLATPPSTLRILNTYDKYPHGSEGIIAFLGDSTHPVTPFSGNGANMALVDALKLATELTSSSHASLGAAVSAYNREMIPRTRAIVDQGRKTIYGIHLTGMVKPIIRNYFIWLVGLYVLHPRLMKGVGVGVAGFVVGAVFLFIRYMFL